MRFAAGRFVGPASLVRSASRRVPRSGPRAPRTSRDVRAIGRESDVNRLIRRYVGEVPRTTFSFSPAIRWFRRVNPWVIDFALGSAFTSIGIVALFTTSDPNNFYRNGNALAVLL